PASGQASSRITLRFPLTASDDTFWTFSSNVQLRSSQFQKARLEPLVFEIDADGHVIERRALPVVDVPRNTNTFVNWNFGIPSPNTDKFIVLLQLHSDNESGGFAEQTSILFKNPLLLQKRNPLQAGTILNYIDAETIIALRPRNQGQLEELYEAGHRLWVVGHREATLNPFGISPEDLARRTVDRINQSYPLSNSKYILAGMKLHTPKICDRYYYEERGVESFNYPPIYTISYRDGGYVTTGIRPEPGADYAELGLNCVDPFNANDERAQFIREEIEQQLRIAEIYGERAVGIYLFDEANTRGLPVSLLEKVYQYISMRRPDLALLITHSHPIGKSSYAVDFPEDFQRLYLSPTEADIILVDWYTIPRLRTGDASQQERFLRMLENLGMLSKPFIRLIGTPVGSLSPCLEERMDYLRIFELMMSPRDSLSEASRRNWSHLGFWAYFNKEARAVGASWDGTLAYQRAGYCHAQYEAAKTFSYDYRLLP
ncbi:MAG: hypothetical protein KDD60_09960, partial [Bdellovibrionales bacterium]|nr:hypothetical protein [Bdellovibrionales bacterium]